MIMTAKYKCPPIELLREGIAKISVDAEEQLENKEKIKKTLLDFGIPIISIEATVGPTVTLYEIVPDKRVRIAKIRNLVDDIALSLSAEGVRIIAPIPGKGTLGIEVANKDPQTVSMRTVIKSRTYQESKYHLPIALGSTISNEVYIADLAKMPHLLVAGATGQGKSVGLNAIIASLLYRKTPDELKFVMIDPKMVDFSFYAKIEAHYLAKIPGADDAIITDMDKVVATLSSLCVEMDNRYQLLKEAHAKNLIEYNDKIKARKLNPLEGHRFLPYIVVVVDEFSDLIMTAGKEIEIPIARLAQKARAVGMHVIIATQHPSTNVITGIIKANFPARIAFKVSSSVDSKTILDTTGAQQLIGQGDMLICNSSPMVRVQCAFIDTSEVEEICDYIARQPYGQGAYQLPDPVVTGSDSSDSEMGNKFGDKDPLFDEVARLIVSSNTASTSSLQRRYSIGYNRARKIMDQIEDKIKNDSIIFEKVILLGIGNTGMTLTDIIEENKVAGVTVRNIDKKDDLGTLSKCFVKETEVVVVVANLRDQTEGSLALQAVKAAKGSGKITVAVLTTPDIYEGEKKFLRALDTAVEIRHKVDSSLIINKIRFNNSVPTCTFEELISSLVSEEQIIADVIQNMISLISGSGSGSIKIDHDNLKDALMNSGTFTIVSGSGIGKNRIRIALKKALSSPLLKHCDIYSASNIIIKIIVPKNAPVIMKEIQEVSQFVEKLPPLIDVIWGGEESDEDNILSVIIIISGFTVKMTE